MLDDGARDVHGVALRAGYEGGSHLRNLRVGEINEIGGSLIEGALVHIADDADDFGPVLAIIERDAVPDGVFIAENVAGEGLIDDGDAWLVGAVAAVEGATAGGGNPEGSEIVGTDDIEFSGGPGVCAALAAFNHILIVERG